MLKKCKFLVLVLVLVGGQKNKAADSTLNDNVSVLYYPETKSIIASCVMGDVRTNVVKNVVTGKIQHHAETSTNSGPRYLGTKPLDPAITSMLEQRIDEFESAIVCKD